MNCFFLLALCCVGILLEGDFSAAVSSFGMKVSKVPRQRASPAVYQVVSFLSHKPNTNRPTALCVSVCV